MGEQWLSFVNAASLIARRSGVKFGEAETLLRGLIADGRISTEPNSEFKKSLEERYAIERAAKPESAFDVLGDAAARNHMDMAVADNPLVSQSELIELMNAADQASQVSEPSLDESPPGQQAASSQVIPLAPRRRNKRDRARQAITALWPEGVPDQSVLANDTLCRRVTEWLEKDCTERNIPAVDISDDTILRAAGRMK